MTSEKLFKAIVNDEWFPDFNNHTPDELTPNMVNKLQVLVFINDLIMKSRPINAVS